MMLRSDSYIIEPRSVKNCTN